MKKKTSLFFILFLFAISLTNAQKESNFGNIPITKVKTTLQKSTDQSIFFSELKPIAGTEFRLLKTETDKLGITHTTYQQYYNGIKVEFGTLKIHGRNTTKESYNGAYFNPSGINTSARIQKQSIINSAKTFFNTTDIFWIHEDEISKTKISEPQLVILPNRRTKTLYLAYTIGVGTSTPTLKSGILFIDAKTGKVIKFKNQLFSCFEAPYETSHKDHSVTRTTAMFASGTGATVYSGSQTIETTLSGSDYILYDQSRANTGSSHDTGIATKNGITTVNFNHDSSVANYNNSSIITEFTDANNNWTAANLSSDEDQYALDAHWGAQVVYDYFKNEHARNSYDGNNSSIVSYVHFGTNVTNAYWQGFTNKRGFMVYGDGDGSFTPLTSLDVAAHEIGHGITNNTAELDYELESGAMNEGFSDIWAMVIENYANNNLGTSKDFSVLNEENGGGAIRSMSNPNAYGLPDTYGGTYWYDVTGCTPDANTNDYCGVHTNSGVLSYWFWVLSQGGTGTNDIGDGFTVTAIGMDDAAAIAYRMQNTYLTATSDYANARSAGIQAAIDLFGTCSSQEEAVTNAFYAVGVGTVYTATNPSIASQPSNESGCEAEIYSFTATGSDYDTLIWQENDGSGWTDLSDDTTYSGSEMTTLTMSNATFAMNGNQYRLQLTNSCGTTNSNGATLTIEENPTATITVQNESCSGDDGELTITFPDNLARSNIEFSINGGGGYPYNYLDNTGTQTITGLASDTYTIWVRWGNNECPVELGDYTIAFDCYTAIPDANFEAELEALGYDDISGDGQVPTASINTITSLNLFNKNISSLVGIEDFIALTSLDASINSLTTLDVSSNVLLETLILFSNELTSLDFTNNTALNSLTIDFNELTSLNITTCLNLETLGCSENLLTTLNLANNTALKEVNLNKNNLASLDLSNNIVLEDLNVNQNSITTLDVSNNIALTDLAIELNGLTSLNLGTITSLININCETNSLTSLDVSNNIALETLNCIDNSITSLDVSQNSALTVLQVKSNNLTSLDVRNGTNTIITNFDAEYNTGLQCIFVDDAAYSTTNWTDIDTGTNFTASNYCDYTAIPDANFEAALETLGYDDISGDGQVPTTLIEVVTSLNVNNESITDFTGIENFVALTYLNVSDNTLTTIDLSNNTLLETLDIQFCALNTLDVSNLVALRNLYANGNTFTTIDISTNTNLKELGLYGNQLNAIDVSTNTALTNINLFQNNLTTIDLSNNTLLRTIELDNNDITSLDLSNHSNLENLTCNNNELTYLNIQNGNNANITSFNVTNNANLTCILIDDIANTSNLTNIDVGVIYSETYCRYTTIPDANFEAALDALGHDDISGDGQVPTALIEVIIDLNVNNQNIIDITGIEAIIALKKLWIKGNSITTVDLSIHSELTSFRAENNNLISLDVTNNLLLTDLRVQATGLTEVDLSNNPLLTILQINNNQLTELDLTVNTLLTRIRVSDNNLTSLDLSNQVVAEQVQVAYNELSYLNLKNGNNGIISTFEAANNDDLICILVDDATYSTTNWTAIDTQTSFNETSCDYVVVAPKVFLQGALLDPNTGEESWMRDDLRVQGPLYNSSSPYGDGAEMSESIGLNDAGSNSTVDWIWVELRDATDNTIVIAGQSAILQRDGDIVDVADDRITPLTFEGVPVGSYYVVIKHRNHLGIMTASAITLSQTATTVDFTNANNQITYGSEAQTTFGMPTDIVTMWAGNANGDTVVQYSGTSPDTPNILSEVLNDSGNFLNFPTYILAGYNYNDIDMDGNTQYSGTNPDTPFILQNVLAHPGNFLSFSTYQIQEQLPENFSTVD